MKNRLWIVVVIAEVLMLIYLVTSGILFFSYDKENPVPDWLRFIACALLALSGIAMFIIPFSVVRIFLTEKQELKPVRNSIETAPVKSDKKN